MLLKGGGNIQGFPGQRLSRAWGPSVPPAPPSSQPPWWPVAAARAGPAARDREVRQLGPARRFADQQRGKRADPATSRSTPSARRQDSTTCARVK